MNEAERAQKIKDLVNPCMSRRRFLFLGAAAQFGIFATLLGALGLTALGLTDFSVKEAAAIGIIGGADGPTAIYVAGQLAPNLLGAIAVATKHELVLAIVGGLFVVEALSVIIQVLYFKRTGRRVFLMAPIHHHYEKKGWAEPTIVIRFWIISLILAVIGLATLKVR